MGKTHKKRLPTPQQIEALQKELQNVAAMEKQMDGLRSHDEKVVRKRPKIFLIILLLAAIWGLSGLDEHYKHSLPRWFLMSVSAILVILCSGFLVYSWIRRKTYSAAPGGGCGAWVYRDDMPLLYWFGMALLSLYDAACIYVLFHLLIKGSV